MNAPRIGTPGVTSRRYAPMSASSSTLRPVTVPSRRADSVIFWIWSRPWCAGQHRLGARLGPLHRAAHPPRHQQAQHFLRGDLELAAEPAADVRRDHAELVLGDAGDGREHPAQDVRDLGRGPDGEHVRARVDDDRTRFHERRDQPLLPESPFQHHFGGGDLVLDIGAAARLARSRRSRSRSCSCRDPGARDRCPAMLPACPARPAARRSRRRSRPARPPRDRRCRRSPTPRPHQRS